jgi:hypothetical protein
MRQPAPWLAVAVSATEGTLLVISLVCLGRQEKEKAACGGTHEVLTHHRWSWADGNDARVCSRRAEACRVRPGAWRVHVLRTSAPRQRFYPTDKNLPIGEMIKQNLDPAFAQLKKVIDRKDVDGFGRAYDLMTEACNTCHAGTQHEFIRLQRPMVPSLTNQI